MAVPRPALALALDAHRAGNLDHAEQLYLQIVANETASHETGDVAAAHPAGDPSVPTTRADAHHWLGVLQLQQHRAAEALTNFEAALAIAPAHGAARLNLGHALRRLDRQAAAIVAFGLASRVADAEIAAAAHAALGATHAEAGDPDKALAHFDLSLNIAPRNAMIHDSRGAALAALGRHQEAEQAHRAALALRPGHAGTHNNLGLAAKSLGRLEDACWHFRDALRIDPHFVPALVNLGQTVALSGDYDQASAPLERAVAIAPDFAPARSELAHALAALGRYEDAARHYEHALTITPDDALTWQNLGAVRFELGDQTAALPCVDKALALNPALAPARFSRASLLLARGDYRQGWREYEARHLVWQATTAPSSSSAAPERWLGSPSLAGSTILLHAEQGFGDTLQFFRFVHAVAARAKHVHLEVQPALLPLLSPVAASWGVSIHARGNAPTDVDWHCPLASLPLALGMATVDSPLAARPPYLATTGTHPVPAGTAAAAAAAASAASALTSLRKPAAKRLSKRLVARFAAKLRRRRPRRLGPLKVGIAWSGRRASLTHAPDAAAFDKRAIPFDALAPLFALPGIEWHVLQTEMADADRDALLAMIAERTARTESPHASHYPITLDGDTFNDFADSAAAIARLDHVVSIDTSVAHLAGAMGYPVTLMLPLAADWRWHAKDAHGKSAWYPSATLVRQSRRTDWSDVIQRVAEILRRAANTR